MLDIFRKLVLATLSMCLLTSSFMVHCVANGERVYITGVKPVPGITVDWLLPYEEVIARLPSTTIITLSNGSEIPVALKWISITDPEYPEFVYDPYSSSYLGYLATATFELPEGVYQPDPPIPLKVTTRVRQRSSLLPGLYPGVRPPLTLAFPGFNQPGTYKSAWIMLDGFNRTYHYYVPTSYDGTKPVPLVFSLHGGGSCGLAALLGVDDCAEKHGFIAVCPDYALGFVTDFVSAIIGKMIAEYNIDTRRIYACGISMGGTAAATLALRLPDKIAAVGLVSGGAAILLNQMLPRPMTIIMIGGSKERVIYPVDRNLVPGMLATAKWLVDQYHCDPEPEITEWVNPMVDFRTNVTRYVWSGGIYGTEVIVYAIWGGGHCWPGGLQYAIPCELGWVSRHVEAWEDCLWPYLSRHALPEEVTIDIKPGSFPNTINLNSKGVVPVAILTTDNFDATKVDPRTVRFGREGWEAKPVHHALEDVDNDGDVDMILHFRTQETGIKLGDTIAKLTGRSFYGTDAIKTKQ